MSFLGRAALDLFILAWPALPSDAFDGNPRQVDDFTFRLAESKIRELDTASPTVSHPPSESLFALTGIMQAALVAGVVATLYSSSIFDQSPWPTQVLIGSSFILSLLSVRKAFQLSYILRRLELHGGDDRTQAGDRIRRQLATKEHGRWVPSPVLQRLWNSPVLYLNLATIALISGYAWAVLAAAADVGFDWSRRETKVTQYRLIYRWQTTSLT
jgi:hypothetical protein